MGALGGVIFGLLLPYAWPGAPPTALAWTAVVAGGIFVVRRYPRALTAACLGLAWSCVTIHHALADRRIDAHRDMVLTGIVTGLPARHGDMLEFMLRPDRPAFSDSVGEGLVRVRWYRDPVEVIPGERWRLSLRLSPARDRVNFAGGDLERWYFARGVTALGRVNGPAERLPSRRHAQTGDRARFAIRERLKDELAGHPGAGLVIALAVGDRTGLDARLRDALAVTGTGHLLAISGLHVGLVAMFAFGVARCLSFAWPVRWATVPPRFPCWMVAFSAAAAYSVLAGFSTSTRRALVMLAVWALCGLARRRVLPFRAWALALATVLALDPRSPAEAGFWLSFGAVAVLLVLFVPRFPRPRGVRALVMAQVAIGLAMLPPGLLWFGQVSAGGLVVNLLAIPWVSAINLPLVLAGLSADLLRLPLAELLLYMAADASEALLIGLQRSAEWFGAARIERPRPGVVAVGLAAIGALVMLLPRGPDWRHIGVWLWLPLLAPQDRNLDVGEARVELLDVGQGMAALVDTRHRRLLYDTGPGVPGTWDLHDSVLAPAFAADGVPDWVLVSHGDLDHAGALDTLRSRYPDQHRLGNLPRPLPDVAPCHDRRYWRWDGVRFDVLHPSPWLPYLGNDSACVLAVAAAGGGVLLPGDIRAVVERRLATGKPGDYHVLVAPHHGSRTSTGAELLEWARPETVLFATGAGNRFGFPHEDVRRRVRHHGARFASTADCGAIRVSIGRDGCLDWASARRTRSAPWRWPAAPECP